MTNYRLYEYEVWGNDEDGFETNNLYNIGEYEIPDEASEEEILKIIDASEHVEIDNNSCSQEIYLQDKRNGKPLGELRKIED